MANYSDGTSVDVTNQATTDPVKSYVFTAEDATAGEKTFTVSYTDGDITETGEFTVTVIPATLESITV
ncbi:MAG: hypothetical protein MJ200_00850, partial [Mycoplasmoidaceae bacterium]|nr:hypothetical protein [Mycoplasmoidaceae bacterium]